MTDLVVLVLLNVVGPGVGVECGAELVVVDVVTAGVAVADVLVLAVVAPLPLVV